MPSSKRKDKIFPLISTIYPEAVDLLSSAWDTPALKIARYYPSRSNPGAFCLVEEDDYIISYLSFHNDLREPAASEIEVDLKAYRPVDGSKEFYCNIYGRNTKAMARIAKLGFNRDLLGYKLKYAGTEPPRVPPTALVEKGFLASAMQAYSELFDRAYYTLNLANGWPTDWHSRYAEAFALRLQGLADMGGVGSFWLDDQLVGVYLIQGIYISDLAVHPQYQNRGFGRAILRSAIRKMLAQMNLTEVRLNVAYTNTRARLFYERNNFYEIGCFADHTYVGEK